MKLLSYYSYCGCCLCLVLSRYLVVPSGEWGAVEWRRETRSVLLIAMIMICLQNRAVGYIYHLTAFSECRWWRAEQTLLFEILTQIHKDLKKCVTVCVCVSMRIQTLTDYYTGLHSDTSRSINIHHSPVCC